MAEEVLGTFDAFIRKYPEYSLFTLKAGQYIRHVGNKVIDPESPPEVYCTYWGDDFLKLAKVFFDADQDTFLPRGKYLELLKLKKDITVLNIPYKTAITSDDSTDYDTDLGNLINRLVDELDLNGFPDLGDDLHKLNKEEVKIYNIERVIQRRVDLEKEASGVMFRVGPDGKKIPKGKNGYHMAQFIVIEGRITGLFNGWIRRAYNQPGLDAEGNPIVGEISNVDEIVLDRDIYLNPEYVERLCVIDEEEEGWKEKYMNVIDKLHKGEALPMAGGRNRYIENKKNYLYLINQ